jgi:four helix bundle protein
MGKEKELKSFEDLKVWKHARKIQGKVSELAKTFPKEEKYRLNDQMIRSSRSIARNIAEGYGRYHYQENIQFCRQSRCSLTELMNDFLTAYEEDYIDETQLESYKLEVETCHRLLNGNIRYLKRAKKDSEVKDGEIVYKPFPNNQ